MRDTLNLELFREKTLIAQATSQAAEILDYNLVNQQAKDKLDLDGRRKVNCRLGIRLPTEVIEQGFQGIMVNSKPTHRNSLLADDDYTIISRYQA